MSDHWHGGDGIQVLLDEAPCSDYMRVMDAEDAKLERALSSTQARYDSSQITRLEAAKERISALETHMTACQEHRAYYLGGM